MSISTPSSRALPPEPTGPVPRRVGRRSLIAVGAGAATASLVGWSPAIASRGHRQGGHPHGVYIASGETLTVSSTRELRRLEIEEGGRIVAPEGHELTLTVNGVEVGTTLTSLYDDDGIDAYVAAGTYRGRVVITVATANEVVFNSHTWPFRQALYVDGDGVDVDRSVLAAVQGGQVRDAWARHVRLRSRGEAFNGVYVAGGDYLLDDVDIRFDGNGRNDFCGYGAAVYATGADTLLRVEGSTVDNVGVVRTAVVADGGSRVVVKDSTLCCLDGELPAEYENTGDTTFMMTCPWLLGMYGTVRTTNLLGAGTRATYLRANVTVENWGCLSVDSGQNCVLVSVNSRLRSTGSDGYGSYGIGNVTEHFLGTSIDVGSYIMINWGTLGTHYGDSSPAALQALQDEYDLGLTGADIHSVWPRASTLRSRKFGFMWQSNGAVVIDGATALRTVRTAFLSKASQSEVVVDGSGGASVVAENGVVYQLMDNDNPGGVDSVDKPWSRVYTKAYVEPTDPAVKSASWDPTVANATDARGTFTKLRLEGDFYNSVLGGGVGNIQGKNLVLDFDDTRVRGVISASTAKHRVSSIDFSNYEELGVVDNAASPVVNNGVLVTLGGGSVWTVTGDSHLSALTLNDSAAVRSKRGGAATITLDGDVLDPVAGTTYVGVIVVSP
ncbi:hypothetical protein [Nocardioides mangrovi]|uniref:Uncharacterized protein n=1 Tax=Nocardioides mangrovi TaxID=2874580 RepID=A0ABS7UFD7_9ACTN|nr:hypothetical protein [Nocardioides mangrovi]MBZ5739560.1 hypothetical protein [Nocardioides mangrovi]